MLTGMEESGDTVRFTCAINGDAYDAISNN